MAGRFFIQIIPELNQNRCTSPCIHELNQRVTQIRRQSRVLASTEPEHFVDNNKKMSCNTVLLVETFSGVTIEPREMSSSIFSP